MASSYEIMDSLVAAALVAAAAAGREASRRYDWSATEGAAMVAAQAAGERALNDGATAESALAVAAAAWRTVPLVEDWSTAAGAAIVAAQIAGCLVARDGSSAEKEDLEYAAAAGRARTRVTQLERCETGIRRGSRTTALGAAETAASCNSSRALELGLNHGPALRTTACASPRVFLGVHPAGN